MSSGPQPSIWTGGLILAGLAAVCTALVALTHATTAPRIAANEQAYLEQSLKPVLGGIEYDGALSGSTILIPTADGLPGTGDATVYRVYADERPVAALFMVSARDGYAGPIRLLIGVTADGDVTGVRVLDHRETPGLGDKIELSKSDWILQFNGRSLKNPEVAGWAIQGDNGEFDQLTGASITSRSVIKATKETLLYFSGNDSNVFAEVEDDE